MKFRFEESITSLLKHLDKRPALAGALAILWLGALGWLAFLWNLGNIGLVDETEPLFAEAARQMVVTGDWITPYWNGLTRFDKPPLIYWLMAIAYHSIGVNEWAVRLPSAMAAIALTGLGFYVLLKYGSASPREPSSPLKPRSQFPRQWTPWIGSALIALNPETIAWGRTGVSDMLLAGCMCSALLTFFLGYAQADNCQKPSYKWPFDSLMPNRWYLAFYILIALAILTKGPVGLVLPGIIIGCFTLYLGNFREVCQEMRLGRGLLIILAIALPWYILVTLANGDAFIGSFFGYHNFQRFTQVVNRHSAPEYFYFLVVLVGFFPWSIYLPVAIAQSRFWQRTYWRRQPRSAHLGLFALFWFACIFGFFTIAVTKLPSYVLPLMPAAAILVALFWNELLEKATWNQVGKGQAFSPGESIVANSDSPYDRDAPISSSASGTSQKTLGLPLPLFLSFAFNALLLLVVAGVVFYSFHWLGDDPAMPNLPQVLQQSGSLIRGGLIWGLAAVATALLLWRRREHWILNVNLLAFIAFMILSVNPIYALVDQERQLPLRQLAQIAVQQKLPGEELMMVGFPKPSLVFYTQEPVIYHRLVRGAIEHIQEAQNRPPASILIVGYPSKLTELGLESNQYQSLGSAGAYQLARVPKQALANHER